MRSLTVLVFILVSYFKFSEESGNGCKISYPKQKDRNQPFILKHTESGWRFPLITNGSIILFEDDSVILLCSGKRNMLKQVQKNLTTASCKSDETLRLETGEYEFADLQCVYPPLGSVRKTNELCGNNIGRIINIGLRITGSQWISLVDVCYNNEISTTLYSEHILYGQSINNASRQSYRPRFSEDGLESGISANSAYKSQNITFTQLLGSFEISHKYITKRSYLSRGHLAPDADFLYPGWQFSTYFYINTCPQWQSINGGIWSKIESYLRKLSHRYFEQFRVFTGSHGILSLPDVNGTMQNIYLHQNEKIPVPKYFWKIVYSDKKQIGTALVAANSPFREDTTLPEALCDNICSVNGWPEFGKLQYYCCDIRQLRNVIPVIPNLVVRGVLNGISGI